MPKSQDSLNNLLYDIRRIAEHREKLSENRIKKIYKGLVKDLDAYLGETYTKYADSDGRLFVSSLDAKRKRAKFLQEIIENVDNIAPEFRKEAIDLIDSTYSKCYKGMASSVKTANSEKLKEIGADLSVQPNVLKQAVNNNISKLTLSPVLEKHRAELIAQLQQELNIGLINGDRYEQMAKRIHQRCEVSYSKATNIVRTESHRNVENGFMDCAENLSDKLEGSNLVYACTWRTAGDERVRPNQVRRSKSGFKITVNKNGANHQQMEGITIKVGDFFDLGNSVKAKNPGNSGSAANDCNCRCYLEYNLLTQEEFNKLVDKKSSVSNKKAFTNENKSGIIQMYRGKGLEVSSDSDIPSKTIKQVKQATKSVTSDFKVLETYSEPIVFGNVEDGLAENHYNPNTGLNIITLRKVDFAHPDKLLKQLQEDFITGTSYETDTIQSLVAHEMGHNAHIALALKRANLLYGKSLTSEQTYLFDIEYKKIAEEIYPKSFDNNLSFEEIQEQCIKQLGLATKNNPYELIAQSFGNFYYGKHTSKIAKSIIAYFKEELR